MADRIRVALIAHGERGGAGTNAVLAGHAAGLANDRFATSHGVLNGEPSLEACVAELTAGSDAQSPLLIYPFFMSAGYFVGTVMVRRLAEAGLAERCRILTPFGEDTAIVDLVIRQAKDTASRAGLAPASTRLVLVGHGSKSGAPASARSTRKAAEGIAACAIFSSVETAFLEEAPYAADVIAGSDAPTVVAGFFNGDGLHAAEDVPEAIAEAGGRAVYTGPIGAGEGARRLIATALQKASLCSA